MDPPTPFPILNVDRPYNSVSTTMLHCDWIFDLSYVIKRHSVVSSVKSVKFITK